MFNIFKKASFTLALLLVVTLYLPGNVSANSASQPAHIQAEMSISNAPSEWQNYIDSEYGFQVGYPAYGWTAEIAFQNETQEDDVIRKRITISNEEFAFINIDVWNNLAGLSILEWIEIRQKSLLDVNATIPIASNVTVAGIDGFFIVQPPNLEQQIPGRIITVLLKDSYIYRIEYVAQDGGTAQDLYISMLETFDFGVGSTLLDNLPQAPFFDNEIQNQTQSYMQAQTLSTSCCNLTDSQYNPYPCSGGTGNCTWYAAYARDDLPYQNQIWGNAEDWITHARNVGYSTGTIPKVGAIMVLQSGVQGAGAVGHVAYVEHVYSSNSFRVKHMNWNGICISTYNFSTGSGVDFIYDSPTTTPPTSSFTKSSPANSATITIDGTSDSLRVLNWSDAQIATTDRYQYCIDEIDNSQCDSNWTTRNTLYSGDGEFSIQAGHTYHWQVRTRDSNMYANDGEWWSFTIGSSLPGAFSKNGPANGSMLPSPLTLSWGPSTDATSYKYCISTSTTCTGWTNVGNNLNVTVTNVLSSHIKYYWQVSAVNNDGEALADGGLMWSLLPSSADVKVHVGGTLQAAYIVAAQSGVRTSYAGLDSGPVKVQSSNGVPIIASTRVAYSPDGGTTWTSFSELMGLPQAQLSTNYMFPWYNNVDLNTQLRIGNVGTTNTTVTVTVGGVVQGTYGIQPNQSTRISYAGLNNGPVKVQSSNGVPIIASTRVAYSPDGGTTWTSFSELMGLPQAQLSTNYMFPWYNNVDLNTQLRIGVP